MHDSISLKLQYVVMWGTFTPIFNNFPNRLVNTSRNDGFWRGYPNLMHQYENSLNVGGWNLAC